MRIVQDGLDSNGPTKECISRWRDLKMDTILCGPYIDEISNTENNIDVFMCLQNGQQFMDRRSNHTSKAVLRSNPFEPKKLQTGVPKSFRNQ